MAPELIVVGKPKRVRLLDPVAPLAALRSWFHVATLCFLNTYVLTTVLHAQQQSSEHVFTIAFLQRASLNNDLI